VSEPGIGLSVVGALFTLYVVAATWRSKDAGYPQTGDERAVHGHTPPAERRIVHWWRARRRARSFDN
jgi:hypothetical protein